MMKRILSLVAVLCLVMTSAVCCADETVDYSAKAVQMIQDMYAATDGQDDGPAYYQTMFMLGGKLCVVTYDGCYVVEGEGWKKIPVSSNPENGVDSNAVYTAPDGNSAYGLANKYNSSTGENEGYQIRKYTFEENGSVMVADGALLTFEKSTENSNVVGIGGDDSSMYFLITDYMTNANTLYAADISSGECRKICDVEFAQGMVSLGGKIYVLCLDFSGVWSGESLPYIVRIDPVTGSEDCRISLDKAFNVMNMAVDSENIYYRDDGSVYRVDKELTKAEKVAYLPSVNTWTSAPAVICDGMYCAAGEKLVRVSVNPDDMQKTVVTISSGFNDYDGIVETYMKKHPDVAVTRGTVFFSQAEDYRTNMQSDSACDIYAISMADSAFSSLRDKGYMGNLAENQAIAAVVNDMYPVFSEPCTDGGKLHALPYSVETGAPAYFPSAFKHVGLTEDDVPRTIPELLDFVEKYAKEIQPEYPEMQLLSYGTSEMKMTIFSKALEQALIISQKNGTFGKINTPAMLKVMDRIDSMKPVWDSLADADEDGGSVTYYGDDRESTNFFENYANILPGENYSWLDETPIVFSIDEETPAYLSIAPYALVLNPYSKNKAAALDFIQYVAENMNTVTKVRLLQSANEPVLKDGYEKRIEETTKTLNQFKEGIDDVTEELDRDTWEMYIENLENRLESLEKDKWSVSPEDLEDYADLVSRMVIMNTPEYAAAMSQSSTLLQRYIDGQMSGTQFIKEFSRVLEMAAMENS